MKRTLFMMLMLIGTVVVLPVRSNQGMSAGGKCKVKPTPPSQIADGPICLPGDPCGPRPGSKTENS